MGFWVFMMIMELMMPLMIIGFGYWFLKNPPKEINSVFGYRTKMSMKNIETWNYAHQYCGKIWCRLGILVLPVTVLVMLPVLGQNEDVVGNVGAAWMTAQCMVLLVLPIIWTERALHKKFDNCS